MRTSKFTALLSLVAFGLLLTSCGKVRSWLSGNPAPPKAEVVETEPVASVLDGIPFKLTKESKKWGILALDGTVLVPDTLTAEPSNAVGGLFLLPTGRGTYEYYTAEADPQKVGGEYVRAGLFYADVAPCVERGKNYIQFIKKDGTLAFDFKEVDGKPVEWVGRFHDGLAAFKAGKYVGYVNTQGKVVVEPRFVEGARFNDGLALVVDTAGNNEADYRAKNAYRISIIDVEGRVQEHSFSSADSIGEYFCEGLLTTGVAPEDTLPRKYSFVDPTGTTIIPEHEDYEQLGNMCGTHFAFYNNRGWGIADNQASVIITPIYEKVVFIGKTTVALCLYGNYKILNYAGEQLTKKNYNEMISLEDGQHIIGLQKEKWYLLDHDADVWGEAYYKLSFNPGDEILKR